MNQSKGLSAIGYLSFYFAPLIIPIILFFISKEQEVRHHAKRALISHIIPFILGIIYIILLFFTAFSEQESYALDNFLGSYLFIGFIIFAVISFIIAIWNLVQAIKVLR